MNQSILTGALSGRPVLHFESFYDDYGNSTRIHYVSGETCELLGCGTRALVRAAMVNRFCDLRVYQKKMVEWIGMGRDYPYFVSDKMLMVPVKTRITIELGESRRNYDDVYSFYNFYFFDEDMDLETENGCIYSANDFVINSLQSGKQNEFIYEQAKRVDGKMLRLLNY